MAEMDFYSHNAGRSYPLCLMTNPTERAVMTKLFLDAGIIFGPDAPYNYENDEVYLYSIEVAGDILTIKFRIDSVDSRLFGIEFVFDIDRTIHKWGTCYLVDASNLSGVPMPDSGEMFVVLGELDGAFNLGVGEYMYHIALEPAVIQTTHQTMINSINLANVARDPTAEEEPPDQSTLDYFLEPPEISAIPAITGITGEIQFYPGYNCFVVPNAVTNALEISAIVGEGEGEPCEDIIVTESGVSSYAYQTNCRDYICMINRLGADANELMIVGGPGVTVIPDPNNHKIIVEIDQRRAYT